MQPPVLLLFQSVPFKFYDCHEAAFTTDRDYTINRQYDIQHNVYQLYNSGYYAILWIIGFMGLYSYLKRESQTPSLEIGYLFGVIGAALACTFIVVQQANFMWHDMAMESANTEDLKALARATFRGANRVQAGMDVAFDIFITISWFLFGINIAKKQIFRKILGWVTCILSGGLLTLNMITFPIAPAEDGLIDLGPFLGLWILVVYIWFARVSFSKKTDKN